MAVLEGLKQAGMNARNADPAYLNATSLSHLRRHFKKVRRHIA